MVSKVTVKSNRYTNILMGTVQAAIANGVLDAVRAGDIPKEKANDLGIIVSVWLNPSVITDTELDHQILFDIHRKATSQAIHKAMNNKPDIDWLLENQDKITHKYFQMGLERKNLILISFQGHLLPLTYATPSQIPATNLFNQP